MKQKTKHHLTGLALALAATTALFRASAADTYAPPAPLTPAGPSAGLVNDWLRTQSDGFKPWDLGGQFRARYEMKNSFATPGLPGAIDFRDRGGNPHNDYLLLREKIHIGYSVPWFSIYAETRNSTEGGDDRDPNPETDEFDLHQGYIALGNPKEFPITLKVGRQELSYGDERVIGAFDWNNLGRVFDAAKLRYEDNYSWVDAFVSHVVLVDNHSFNLPNQYETFWGVYGSTKAAVPKSETQLYFLGRDASNKSPFAHPKDFPQPAGASAREIYTAGLRLKSLPGQLNGWDYSTEIMGQFGRFKDGTTTFKAERAKKSLSHEAYAAYVGAGYTWTNISITPRLGVEYNYASGDSDPTDDKHETFENLFPTNHKFYGMMDFISLQNIHNVRFMSSIAPCKQFTLALDYHLFWLADTADSFYTVAGARRTGAAAGSGKGYGLNPGYDSFVGSELDLVATYKIKPWAVAQVGYGHFFTGQYIDQSLSNKAFGSKDADYVYLQTTFTF